ncbi:hypothetical protein B0H13DRAFT_1902096 [Mycena leptocephala]|nr:hypothetical protein B0H13DRAFT_1902096 [Mycena leptocephala]
MPSPSHNNAQNGARQKQKQKKGIIIKRQKRETTHPKQRKTRTDNRYVELLGRFCVGHEGERRGEDGERQGEGDAVKGWMRSLSGVNAELAAGGGELHRAEVVVVGFAAAGEAPGHCLEGDVAEGRGEVGRAPDNGRGRERASLALDEQILNEDSTKKRCDAPQYCGSTI